MTALYRCDQEQSQSPNLGTTLMLRLAGINPAFGTVCLEKSIRFSRVERTSDEFQGKPIRGEAIEMKIKEPIKWTPPQATQAPYLHCLVAKQIPLQNDCVKHTCNSLTK
jgi:hypothetical protein